MRDFVGIPQGQRGIFYRLEIFAKNASLTPVNSDLN